jgi:hypothetical protein
MWWLALIIVLILVILYYSRESMVDHEGEIAVIKAALQRQENILYQCAPNCHEHAVKLSVFDAEVKDARQRLERAQENIALIKSHMECKCTDETPVEQCTCHINCPCKLVHAKNAVVAAATQVVDKAVEITEAAADAASGEKAGEGTKDASKDTVKESFHVKYFDNQRAHCVGSVCLDRVGSNKINLDIQGLIRRLDNQTALIQTLKYELVDRNARIAALRREINYATGMY